MEILVCPVCRGELDLTVIEASADNGEIVEGTLNCPKCDETYAIADGIPDLLPPYQRA